MAAGEHWHYVTEHCAGAQTAVQQDLRFAGAVNFIIQLQAINRGIAI